MKKFFSLFLIIVLLLPPCYLEEEKRYTSRDAPATDVPNYTQWDERWANMIYSNHGDATQTMRKGGCGVCAMANVVAYLCDPSITPVEIAKISMWNGYCTNSGGTSTKLHEIIYWFYPLTVLTTHDIQDVYDCLDSDGLVIATVGRSKFNGFSDAYHAITIYAHTENHFWAHIGASDTLIGQIMGHGTEEQLEAAAYCYYCYWAK